MIAYIKCAWANAFTRIGYLSIAFGTLVIQWPGVIPAGIAALSIGAGIALLCGSAFGLVTLATYQAANEIARKGGFSKLDYLFIAEDKDYCAQKGFELAEREHQKKVPT